MPLVPLTNFSFFYFGLETFLLIFFYYKASQALIESRRFYVIIILACLCSFSISNNLYILLQIPVLGGFIQNNLDPKYILYSFIACSWLTLYLLVRITLQSKRIIQKQINKPMIDPSKINSRHSRIPLSLALVGSMYTIETINIIRLNIGETSFLLGGNYINSSSGLSEYIAPVMAIYITRISGSKPNKIEKFIFSILLISSTYNFLLGMRASASVVMLFLLFVFYSFDANKKQIYTNSTSSKAWNYIPSFALILVGLNTIAGSFRLSVTYHGSLLPPINQFTEVLNTSSAILSLPVSLWGKVFSLSPNELIYGLASLSLPQQIFGVQAAYNPLFPYVELNNAGLQVGGGGHIIIWAIYFLGPVFGILLILSLFELLARQSMPVIFELTLSILAVRLCYYDPLSVILRTFTIGFLIYCLFFMVTVKHHQR